MNKDSTVEFLNSYKAVPFPENLDSMFKQYLPEIILPFRELPTGDYRIVSNRSFKTKNNRDCMVLTLTSLNDKITTVYAPDRLRNQLLEKPNTFNFLRYLGFKTSNSTGNKYFNFLLA